MLVLILAGCTTGGLDKSASKTASNGGGSATDQSPTAAPKVAPVATESEVRALFTDPDPTADTSDWLTGVTVDGASVSLYLAPDVSSVEYAHGMSNHVFVNMPKVKLVITYGADGQEIGRWSEYKYAN